MADGAGKIKMFLLHFLYFFFPFVILLPQSFETSKVRNTTEPRNWICFLAFCHDPTYLYHWKGPLKVLLSFWSVLWKATLVMWFFTLLLLVVFFWFWVGFFFVLFRPDTDFEMVWVISVTLCLPQELTSPCAIKLSSQLPGLPFPSHKAVGSEKAAAQDFTLHHQDLRGFFLSLEWPWSSKPHSRQGSWCWGTGL